MFTVLPLPRRVSLFYVDTTVAGVDSMFPQIRANFYNARGQMFLGRKRDYARAERAFLKAAAAAPGWDVPRFNLGLAAKWQRRWPESLDWNRKSVTLDPTNQAARWNLGIAATALSNWPEARRAWAGFGLEIPAGDGELVMELGPTPIRLDPTGFAEVVWCKRIDPARALIRNVPSLESGHCYGDLLLHDGAPNGARVIHGETIPVFDMIEVLRRSEYQTFELELRAMSGDSVTDLYQRAANNDIGLEDWGAIRCLCAACSQRTIRMSELGRDAPAPPDASVIPLKLMAAAPGEDSLTTMLETWKDTHAGSVVLRIEPMS
jgi:hypothetical protein